MMLKFYALLAAALVSLFSYGQYRGHVLFGSDGSPGSSSASSAGRAYHK